MRLFTRDADDKPDTPFSVWIGLAFIAVGLWFYAVNVAPGELAFSWELGIHVFFIAVGLVVLVPGLMLTMLARPE